MADPQIVPFVLEPPSIGFTSWGIPDETYNALPDRVPGNRRLEDLTQGCPIQAFIPTSRLDDHRRITGEFIVFRVPLEIQIADIGLACKSTRVS